MRLLATAFITAALTCNVYADDHTKTKTKSEHVDPVTGDRVKTKSRVKAESDGDYKSDTKVSVDGPSGKTKAKNKVRAEGDGDYKEKTKVSGPDGKFESKTKVDK